MLHFVAGLGAAGNADGSPEAFGARGSGEEAGGGASGAIALRTGWMNSTSVSKRAAVPDEDDHVYAIAPSPSHPRGLLKASLRLMQHIEDHKSRVSVAFSARAPYPPSVPTVIKEIQLQRSTRY